MRQLKNDRIRNQFLGWQCRIRQISARDYGGQPLAAMRPRVSRKNGEALIAAVTTLLIPDDSAASTAFFRFQVQKSPDPAAVREAGIKYLSGGYYQQPELFSDRLTAVFGSGSEIAGTMARSKEVVLDYEQYTQSFRMFCKVKVLKSADPMREASLWQARIFNRGIAADALVVGFVPDWKSAVAVPQE